MGAIFRDIILISIPSNSWNEIYIDLDQNRTEDILNKSDHTLASYGYFFEMSLKLVYQVSREFNINIYDLLLINIKLNLLTEIVL